MSKRTLAVSFLTAGMTAGLVAGVVGPAAAQGNPVGGAGNVYYLSGAGNTGGVAQEVLVFGDPGDEIYFGDWDNDGVDTPMVNRNGVFHVANKDGKTVDVFAYGNPGDRVVIGDWDDKNGDSMAVVRTEQGSNKFYVKNDVKTTGKADAEFFYGDAGDNLLVGDWDGNGTDTLMVTRTDTSFHVKNDTKTGVADYSFTYGNPGDTIIVGDWANPAKGESGNGADQIAVRRDGNHYFFSKELGKGADIGTAMRDQFYGDPTDTVFAASLPTEGAIDEKRADTYAADVQAKYEGDEEVLVVNRAGDVVEAAPNNAGDVPLHAEDEPKVQLTGAPQYHHGEVKVGANGQPMVYATSPRGDNEVPLPGGGTVPLHSVGDYVLNADGSLNYVLATALGTGVYTPQTYGSVVDATNGVIALPSSNTWTPAAGDPVLYRAGEPKMLPIGTPDVHTSATPVIVRGATGDYKLDANGNVQGGPGAWTQYAAGDAEAVYLDEDGVETTVLADAADFEVGAALLARPGQVVSGWLDNTPTAATPDWSAVDLTSDEAADVYLERSRSSKKVAALDTDGIVEPIVYKGGEPVPTESETPVPAHKGGEAVLTHAKGEVKLDDDGDIVIVGTGEAITITGDGLGVRRNFG